MKRYTGIILATLALLLMLQVGTAEAQIWKKIKKKTKDKVENTISEKASDKAEQLVADRMDEILTADFSPYSGGEKVEPPKDLPGTYSFNWKYQLKMTAAGNDEAIVFDYYLNDNAPYFGYSMPQMATMFSVIDLEKEVMISYMDQDGHSMAMSHSVPTAMKQNAEEDEPGDYEITELPDKEFLGLNSKGFKIDTPDAVVTIYLTSEADVGFLGFTPNNKKQVSSNFVDHLGDQEGALMMYMKSVDKKDAQNTVEMECLSIDKAKLVKTNADYTFR